jgi:hypothetical protein
MICIQIGLYIFSLRYRADDVELSRGPTSYTSDLSDCSTDQWDPSISGRYKEMVPKYWNMLYFLAFWYHNENDPYLYPKMCKDNTLTNQS